MRSRPSYLAIFLASTSFQISPCMAEGPGSSRGKNCDRAEILHRRDYFYVGGRYVDLTGGGDNTGQIKVEQIYVEHLSPATVKQSYPIVFWTGNGQSGTNWLNTPDGRQGWASFFLNEGYEVYLTDQPQRGRSPWDPYANETFSVYTAEYCERYWTFTKNSTDLWPQASLHTQFPGSGLRGDPSFEAFYASQVPARSNQTDTERLSRLALTALLDRIGAAFIVTHSQGGPHGWVIADSRPDLVKGVIAIEPQGPPFVNQIIHSGEGIARPYGITQTPVSYDPPLTSPDQLANVTIPASSANRSECVIQADPPRKLANISKVPILLVTSEAGYHAVYDHCTVKYLEQAGVRVDWLDLPMEGIHGNGHFMFMEKNNLDIAAKIQAWIEREPQA